MSVISGQYKGGVERLAKWNPVYGRRDCRLRRVSNLGPLDQQASALLSELPRLLIFIACKKRWSSKRICGCAVPLGIWRQNDVVLTSMRRHHVASTFIRRYFFIMRPLGLFFRYARVVCTFIMYLLCIFTCSTTL